MSLRVTRGAGSEAISDSELGIASSQSFDSAPLRSGSLLAMTSEHFANVLATSQDVERLNPTILDLAMRGKLTQQDSNDEPASKLIARIKAEKKEATDKSLPPIGDDEVPFDLPKGWEWIRFGDVTINRDGERIPVSKEDRSLRRGEYDYYGASGVIDKIDKYLFDKPLLLIGEDGANLVNRATPIAFIAQGKYWVNNHAHVLDTIDLAILKYLGVFINAIDLKPYVPGTAQPKMNSIVIAVPSLAEQNRIVAKVEQLLAQCDALESKLRAAQTVRERLVQSVMAGIAAGEGVWIAKRFAWRVVDSMLSIELWTRQHETSENRERDSRFFVY